MELILEAKNLKKTFTLSKKQQAIEKTKEKQRIAVADLSFKAYRGEIFGLLGPNGAGKTTTLRILSTLLTPDEGDVVLDGHSLKGEPSAIRARIGFLTNENKLDEFFTPRYHFDFFSDLYGVPSEVRDSRRKALFSRFGIDRFEEVKLANLSTGMKQKTAIAVSLANDPDIVIFDEPTNGLDVLTARSVTDFLLELRERGKTVILSTHIFSLVERVCDRVGIVIDGRMVKEGTLADLVDGAHDLEEAFFNIYSAIKEGDE